MVKQVFIIRDNSAHPARNFISLVKEENLDKIKSEYELIYFEKPFFKRYPAKSFSVRHYKIGIDTEASDVARELEVSDDFFKQLKDVATIEK